MKLNVGNSDRLLRALGAVAMLTCAVVAPFPLLVRIAVHGVPGVYLLLTALFGRCLGYSLLGKSSCPLESQ